MATHPSILAWRIPMNRGACGQQSIGYKKSDMTLVTDHTRCQYHTEKSDTTVSSPHKKTKNGPDRIIKM